jgi:hypothetical protein
MLVDEKELRQRYAALGDDELVRMLTWERLKYRADALAVAEKVLSQRGLTPPPEPFAPVPLPAWPGPPPPGVPNPPRTKRVYGMADLLVDVLLFSFVGWAMGRLEVWTTPAGRVWGEVIYYLTFFALLSSAMSLRQRWRAREWS